MTELYFDDQALFVRENLKRVYAKPEVVGDYYDPAFSIDYPFSMGFRLDDGRVRVLYMGRNLSGVQGFFAAISDDGVHFTPETVPVEFEGKVARHSFMECMEGDEIATIVEDKTAPKEERYKMLFTSFRAQLNYVRGPVFVSADLLHWTPIAGEAWNDGCEPCTGCFYNEHHKCFTVLHRPFWGDRRVVFTDTNDFRHFTPAELVLQEDSLDAPLDELYGMPAFAYEGMYIGFVQMLVENRQVYGGKSNPGNIVTQLAYSYNGHHWNRCLRESYYKDYHGQPCCMWFGNMIPDTDGSLLMYGTYTPHDHGKCFDESTDGRVRIYRARKDGFVALETESGKVGRLATRHRFWQGGELKINLKAQRATVQILDMNNQPVEGFTHEDCAVFSGDDTDWVPAFKGGSMDRFHDTPIVIEICLTDGALYAMRHNGFQLMGSQVRRYKFFGKEHMIFDPKNPYPEKLTESDSIQNKSYELLT